MKKAYSIRKIDNLGRIVIPMDIRRALEIQEWDELRIYLDSNEIKIVKAEPECTFCENSENLSLFQGKYICQNCLAQLKENSLEEK